MIADFQAGTGPGALVLSLKAGGTGLNLTAASHVVLYDRWWNPAVEDQARDRAWRIGQTRTVVCHRLVCPGTVDERVEEVVAGKRQIADLVLPKSSSIADLDAAQLRQALGLTDELVVMEDTPPAPIDDASDRAGRWLTGAPHEPPSPSGQRPRSAQRFWGTPRPRAGRDDRPGRATRPPWWPRSGRHRSGVHSGSATHYLEAMYQKAAGVAVALAASADLLELDDAPRTRWSTEPRPWGYAPVTRRATVRGMARLRAPGTDRRSVGPPGRAERRRGHSGHLGRGG